VSKRRRGTNPREDWSTKELQEYIRKATAEAQQRINEYESLDRRGRTGIHFRNSVKALRKASGTKSKNPMKISLNLRKNKGDLLKQAKELQKFLKRKSTKDITEKAIKQKEVKEEIRRQRVEYDLKKQKELEDYRNEIEERAEKTSSDDSYTNVEPEPPADEPFDDPKKERAYETYRDRYDPDLTRDEYDDLVDVWNAIEPYLDSFGYEKNKGNYTPAGNVDITENVADLADDYDTYQIQTAMKEVIRRRQEAKNNDDYWTTQRMLVELEVVMDDWFGNDRG
jgi:hypothetical protein